MKKCREDKINDSIVNAVISVLPWAFVIKMHDIIPVVMIIQLVFVLAYGLFNEFYLEKEEV